MDLTLPCISSEGDHSCVWVHDRGECVARFGRAWYEVFSAETPRRMIARGRTSSTGEWLDFKAKVRETFGHDIKNAIAPVRFHQELEVDSDDGYGQAIFMLPLGEIGSDHDPFRCDIWGRGRFSMEDVSRCLECGDLAERYEDMSIRDGLPAGWDARRVAYFIRHPEKASPISIEVVSFEGEFHIEDGYHRLAAAFFRKDPMIEASLGGYLRGWEAAFPGRLPLSPEAHSSMEERSDTAAGPMASHGWLA